MTPTPTSTPTTTTPAAIATLGANTPRRFYRGGERILAFRGLEVPSALEQDAAASRAG